jgi:hypothetical protein
MIKLNGNVYLTEDEIDAIVHAVSLKFRTPHRDVLPQKITYLDSEFVDAIKTEAKNTILSVFYLYGYGELHAPVKKIITAVLERTRNLNDCCDKLYFMQYDLTDSQRRSHRTHYENFLINAFLGECVLNFKKLS